MSWRNVEKQPRPQMSVLLCFLSADTAKPEPQTTGWTEMGALSIFYDVLLLIVTQADGRRREGRQRQSGNHISRHGRPVETGRNQEPPRNSNGAWKLQTVSR